MLYFTNISKNQPDVAKQLSDKQIISQYILVDIRKSISFLKKKIKPTIKCYNFAYGLITYSQITHGKHDTKEIDKYTFIVEDCKKNFPVICETCR